MRDQFDHRKLPKVISAAKKHFKTLDAGITALTGSIAIKTDQSYRFVSDQEMVEFVTEFLNQPTQAAPH